MAEALAAAVQRLRARVAAVGESREQVAGEAVEPQAERGPGEVRLPYAPPVAIEREQPRAWLAPAIRRVAERRDARLAAELVLELLPAQVLAVESPVRYGVRIAELGSYEVTLGADNGEVHELTAAPTNRLEFVLEGPAAAFAEVAAGGSRLSAWRPPAGLRVKSGRRRARHLLRSRATPLSLSDLDRASVTVWPGLLLLALAEAIDPAWTAGQAFTVEFAIEGRQSAVLQVRAQSGKPLAVTRGGVESASEASEGAQTNLAARPETTVRLSERGFARMLAGEDLAGEKVWLEGERGPLETLLSWTDRVQGIRRQPA